MKQRGRSSIAILLALCLILGLLPGQALAADPLSGLENFTESNTYTTGQFADVAENSWYYENVKSVYELGLMLGKSNAAFDPNGNITVAETITIAVRLYAIYHGGTFDPDKETPWYQPYVDYAKENGIIQDAYSDYGHAATRLQFVTILSGALPESVFEQINQVADNAIPDVKISDDGASAVYLFYRAGILAGNDDKGTFVPSSPVRRSEAAAIITRMVKPELRAQMTLAGEDPDTSSSGDSGDIYAKELDPEHVKTGMLTFDGESYEGQYIDNELIVAAAEGAERSDIVSLSDSRGWKIVGEIPDIGYYQIELDKAYSGAELEKLAAELMKEEAVEDAYVNTLIEETPNAYYPDDYEELYKDKASSDNSLKDAKEAFWKAQDSGYIFNLMACNVPEAWELVRQVNPDAVIRMGIIDASMDVHHCDLNFVRAYSHSKAYDPNKVGITRPTDKSVEHGTHVAGIMGASHNHKGIAGVAFGAELFGIATKGSTLFDRTADVSLLITVDNVSIINMSMGTEYLDFDRKCLIAFGSQKVYKALSKLIDQKYNFLIVTSAGNGGKNSKDDTNYNNVFSKIQESKVKDRIIVVGNADCSYQDRKWTAKRHASSSYRGGRVDVMAPGVAIYSTLPNNQYGWTSSNGEMTGTSMAAPFVAGVAGLIWEANANLTPEQVKQIICESTIPVEDSNKGMVDAEAAIRKALGEYDSPENEVTFVFVDTTTNSGLSTDQLTVRYDDYVGIGSDQRQIGRSVQKELTENRLVMTLDYGEYTLTFTPEGYQKETISVTVDGDAHRVPIHIFVTPDTQQAQTYTLRLRFIEKTTEEKLALTSIFGEDYGGAYIGLADESGDHVIGDLLIEANNVKMDGMFLEDDEVVFTGLELGTYIIILDANSVSYTLPGEYLPYKLEKSTLLGINLTRSDGGESGQLLEGTVILKDTGRPVPGATVHLITSRDNQSMLGNVTATTNENGAFAFTGVDPSGLYWSLGVDGSVGAEGTPYTWDIADNPTASGYGTFDGFGGTLYVTDYSSKQPPADPGNSGKCGDNVYWSVEDGVLTISGTGNMNNYYDSEDEPWWGQSIHSVVVEFGVTGVGFLAFSGQRGLRSVYISETVRYIGKGAFHLCDNLQSITFAGGPPEYAQGTMVSGSDQLFLWVVNGAAAYYPAGDPAWTEEVKASYGGQVTWIAR